MIFIEKRSMELLLSNINDKKICNFENHLSAVRHFQDSQIYFDTVKCDAPYKLQGYRIWGPYYCISIKFVAICLIDHNAIRDAQ